MPTKVERSYWPTTWQWLPELSVDMDLSTYSQSTSDNTGINWYRLSFDNVYCIKEIFWISIEPYWIKWRCTKEDCSECHSEVQSDCTKHEGFEISAEVSTAGTPSQCVDSGSNCKCGDTVFIQHKKRDLALYVKEFVVKQGESISTNFVFLYLMNGYQPVENATEIRLDGRIYYLYANKNSVLGSRQTLNFHPLQLDLQPT